MQNSLLAGFKAARKLNLQEFSDRFYMLKQSKGKIYKERKQFLTINYKQGLLYFSNLG